MTAIRFSPKMAAAVLKSTSTDGFERPAASVLKRTA